MIGLHEVRYVGSQLIAASESYTSDAYDVTGFDSFSLQVKVTGDGTCKFEVLTSNNGVDYLDVSTDILASQTKSTGVSGANMAGFTPVPSGSIKIKVTETGGANSVTVSFWLRAQ